MGPPVVAATCAVLATCAAVGLSILLGASDPVTDTGSVAGATAAEPTGGPTPTASAPARVQPISPLESLRRQVVQDQAAAAAVEGYWVPQISSKELGTVDGSGRSYGHAEILDDFRYRQRLFADAILVRSDDFSSFRSPGFWVTVVSRPFGTAAEANAWCDSERLSADDCFAKRLSRTDPPAGNTVPR